MTEKKLIQACIANQRTAQREFYEKFKSKMFGICLRYARNREEAEDILLDGFFRIFRDLPQFKFQGSLEGWMRKVMVNTALMQLRKKQLLVFQPIDQESLINDIGIEPIALQNIQAQAILKLIQQLPIGYQTIFNLYGIEGFSHKEIAEKLEISESTSRSQYTRARRLLQQLLQENEVV